MAWSPTLGYAPVDDEVLKVCTRAVRVLESLGAEVVEIEPVFDEDPVRDWLTLATAYNLRTLAPYRDTDSGSASIPSWRPPWTGRPSTSRCSTSCRAEDACHRLNTRLVDLFHDVRLLVTPTCAALPPPRGLDGAGMINGVLDANWVRFTYPFNMTRSPAATVCAGLSTERAPGGASARRSPTRRSRRHPLGGRHGSCPGIRRVRSRGVLIGSNAPRPQRR